MSELMDDGIIRMPYEMAMSDELSRKQFYSRANSLLTELTEIRAELAAMETNDHSEHGLGMVPRITEQDAYDIILNFFWFMDSYKHKNAKNPSVVEWHDSEGRDLLNKLNADRERVQAVAVPGAFEIIREMAQEFKEAWPYHIGKYTWMIGYAQQFKGAPSHSQWGTEVVPYGFALVPIERSYDMRMAAFLHYNTAKQSGKDNDDALDAAWRATIEKA